MYVKFLGYVSVLLDYVSSFCVVCECLSLRCLRVVSYVSIRFCKWVSCVLNYVDALLMYVAVWNASWIVDIILP